MVRRLNTNARQVDAMLRLACADNFGGIYDRARIGSFRKAAARELYLAAHYTKKLLEGRVSARYRAEFIQATKKAVSAAREYRCSI